MNIEVLFSKIHRATVTDSSLEYEGSISIDTILLEQSNMMEYQKVDVLNINNGERFQTYIINGKHGSGEVCINGAGARKVQKGDKIIIVAYASLNNSELKNYKPTIIFVDEFNYAKD